MSKNALAQDEYFSESANAVVSAYELYAQRSESSFRKQPSALRAALAGLIGNALEWFDFAVYGYFAGVIGQQFFPKSSATAQQLLTFAVYAIGFFTRPLGSLVLGMVGDRIGRRTLLVLSIGLMGGSTLMMGLLPTYAQIGAAAPLLLVTLRMIQGFSVGGEYTGSMVFATESSSKFTRGLVGSSTAAGVTVGFILGSGSAWLVNRLLPMQEVLSWGWRVPFIASLFFCIVGWLLRRGLHETAEGVKARESRPPLFASLAADWLPIVRTFGIAAISNVAYYLTFAYVVEQRQSTSKVGAEFLLANTVSLVIVLFAKVFGGWLSDQVGRRRLMIILTFIMICLAYPTYRLMLFGTPSAFVLGQILVAIPMGMAGGLQGSMLVEIFPLRTRVTSLSIAYSLTMAVAGGTTPFMATWLSQRFGNPLAPAYYVILYGFLALAVLVPMAETNELPLDR